MYTEMIYVVTQKRMGFLWSVVPLILLSSCQCHLWLIIRDLDLDQNHDKSALWSFTQVNFTWLDNLICLELNQFESNWREWRQIQNPSVTNRFICKTLLVYLTLCNLIQITSVSAMRFHPSTILHSAGTSHCSTWNASTSIFLHFLSLFIFVHFYSHIVF